MAVVTQKQIGINARRATDAGRYYEVEGQMYPSVTTVLSVINKPALVPWAAKMERIAALEAAADLYEDVHGTPRMSRAAFISSLESRIGKEKAGKKEMEKAGEIGTQIHSLAEWNLRKTMGQVVGPEPHVTQQALWAFMVLEEKIKELELEPVRIEQVLFSQTYGIAGTMDLLANVKWHGSRKLALIDFKSGKAVYSEAYLQVSAYAQCLQEMGFEHPDIGIIIRLPKIDSDPEAEVVEVPDMDYQFQIFLHTLELYKWHAKQEAEYKRRVKEAKGA